MGASLAGAVDDGGNEVDPVLWEVVAVVPGGIAGDAVGVLLPFGTQYGFSSGWNPLTSPIHQPLRPLMGREEPSDLVP